MCQLSAGSKFKLLRALIAEVQPTLKIISNEKKCPSTSEIRSLKVLMIALQCKILERDGYANFAGLIKRKAMNAGL